MDKKLYKTAHDFIVKIMPLLKQPAEGLFKQPYLNPTYGQYYHGNVFCWDNHHMSLRFAGGGEPEQMQYFLENMLSFQNSTGFTPCIVNSANGGVGSNADFHAQPFLAQNAAIYTKLTGDTRIATALYGKLRKYLDYWLTCHTAPFGLYRWRETYMSGIDNEIAGTLFPPDTIISPDLNAWLYLELRSMAYLAGVLNDPAAQQENMDKSERLKQAINTRLWDEQFGVYAAYDLCAGKTRVSWGDGTLSDEVGRYAYLSCPALIPLFARIAEPERARSMIRKYVLAPEHFRSPYGIRSLSRSSEYYNNARWGNPPRFGDHRRLTSSNWQGPVWIPLNWFAFHALLHYGFTSEAEQLADDTFKVIVMNIETLGFMRENFHAETGAGLYADQFASWNILADLMPDYLQGKEPVPIVLSL